MLWEFVLAALKLNKGHKTLFFAECLGIINVVELFLSGRGGNCAIEAVGLSVRKFVRNVAVQ